jgi:hypothetical protein
VVVRGREGKESGSCTRSDRNLPPGVLSQKFLAIFAGEVEAVGIGNLSYGT